ncbi:MAG: glutamate--tRNA ligase [Thermoflavifilum sp.]|uniref:glutamate--tRNA ligase n=1 Tax=Thermoflavifilum sp. TaxID=1968839 RepID=UPI0018A5C985|nr:glutamate--tRNA ligase [Thermoflavifilum sp.]QOR76484.1 MAG: glutamate--tRNA ligase [Thermoflavifilum sp.]
MAHSQVRVRFAPSPTGGLHLGGVRTVLFNYLFARQHGGTFILRIEDTDQTRYVPGAEAYIIQCLEWCGLLPDEGPHVGGPFGPYRQSERKNIYRRYALQLVEQGHAYYAFDTPEELEQRRSQQPNFQYDVHTRGQMRNSLTLPAKQVQELLQQGHPYVIRMKMPENTMLRMHDLIRGEVEFHSEQVDDKVLLKADGMPTYHLAVVVDDYLMQISHVFRGEEWLPSTPVHLLLWEYLFGKAHMPQWAHLPLILRPDGHGKLSKRDGDKLGFPVYAMDWTDPFTGETTHGFREMGFLPEAFVNMLALLGWNDGSGQEIFTLDELIARFSIERIHKAGARFDFEKAKWFNHEWIKRLPASHFATEVKKIFDRHHISIDDEKSFVQILELVKERCHLLTDFVTQAGFFFQPPTSYDRATIEKKWTPQMKACFEQWLAGFDDIKTWEAAAIEHSLQATAETQGLKKNDMLLPLRIMLVGGKFGPPVFQIAELLGKMQTRQRIERALQHL